MVQYQFGEGSPAPTHPNDNDNDHLAELVSYTSSSEYQAAGMPNHDAFMAHAQLHQRQIQQKMQMQQQQALQAQQGPGQPQQAQPQPATGAAGPMNAGSAGNGIESNAAPPPTGNGQPNLEGVM